MRTYPQFITACNRKSRLLACACVREHWDLLFDERSRYAVEMAEAFIDGTVTQTNVLTATRDAWNAWGLNPLPESQKPAENVIARAAWIASVIATQMNPLAWIEPVLWNIPTNTQDAIIGDLTQPVHQRPTVPSHVTGLASDIYNHRDLTLYPLLADALADLGLDEMAEHCRQQRHWRGCWVIDLLLQKV